jgi:hypothetical protein
MRKRQVWVEPLVATDDPALDRAEVEPRIAGIGIVKIEATAP